jgi:hypothetical protein
MTQLWNDFSSAAKSLCSTEQDVDPILSKSWEKVTETIQQIAPLHSELVRSHKQIKPTHILLLKQRKKNIKRKCS